MLLVIAIIRNLVNQFVLYNIPLGLMRPKTIPSVEHLKHMQVLAWLQHLHPQLFQCVCLRYLLVDTAATSKHGLLL